MSRKITGQDVPTSLYTYEAKASMEQTEAELNLPDPGAAEAAAVLFPGGGPLDLDTEADIECEAEVIRNGKVVEEDEPKSS